MYRSRHSERGTGRVTVMGESPHSTQFYRQGVPLFSHHKLADSHRYERIQSINGRNTPYGGIYPLIQERSTGRQGIHGINPPVGGV